MRTVSTAALLAIFLATGVARSQDAPAKKGAPQEPDGKGQVEKKPAVPPEGGSTSAPNSKDDLGKGMGKVDWITDHEFGFWKARLEGRGVMLNFYGRFASSFSSPRYNSIFSDEKVLAASRSVVPILADYSNKELAEKYPYNWYGVLYTTPDGIMMFEADTLEAIPIKSDLMRVAQKHPGKVSMWQNTVRGAVANGKLSKKPVAVYLMDPKATFDDVNQQLMKELGTHKTAFLWCLERGTAANLSSYGADSAPSIVIYDTKQSEPLKNPAAKIAIKEDDTKATVNKALDEALKAMKK